MNHFPISKVVLVVLISSAVLLRLPSVCERIARALRNKGKKVLVLDGYHIDDVKTFEFDYKNNRIKADVVILQNSFYVLNALYTNGNSRWHANSVRPHLSYFLHHSDALYGKWQRTGKIDPVAMAGLPKIAFGTLNHTTKMIEYSDDEIFVCGQIVKDVMNCV